MAPNLGRANLSHFLPPLLLVLSALCASRASDSRSPSAIVKALEDVKYTVSVEGAQEGTDEGAQKEDGHLMRFMDDEGVLKTYSCKLPGLGERINPNARDSSLAVAVAEGDAEMARRARDILDQGLKNQCFLKPSGWWIYEFCHNRWVRQYHQDSQKTVRTEHLLGVGKLSPVFDNDFIRTGPSSSATGEVTFGKDSTGPYYATQLLNGSLCDMTKEPRELEVRYYCSKAAEQVSNSMSISEPHTCKYRLTFFTPVACSIPSFQKKPDYIRNIGCTEISREGGEQAQEEEGGKTETEAPVPEGATTQTQTPE